MKNTRNLNVFATLKKGISLIKDNNKYYLLVSFISTVIESIIPPASLLVMQEIINLLQLNRVGDINRIFALVLVYVTIDLFSILEQYIVSYYKTSFLLKFNLELRKKVLVKASGLGLKNFENSEVYDMMQRAESESLGKIIPYVESFFVIFGNVVTAISYLIIIMNFRGWLLPVILIIPIMKFYISNKCNMEQYKFVYQRTNGERKSWYYKYLVTSGIAYKELTIFGLFDFFINKHIGLIKSFNIQDLKLIKVRLSLTFILDVLELIITGLLFVYIIGQGIVANILIGDAITYMKTISSTKSQVASFLQSVANIKQNSMYVNLFFEFLDIEEMNTRITGVNIGRIDSIAVRNLSYQYTKNGPYVLNNINFEIKKNELVTIVGKNGCGKTTLMKILMGFYDDYEGEIFINGVELREIERTSYLTQICALFQDYTKYEATIRENIAFGNLSIMQNNEIIEDIMKKVKIDELIKDDKTIDLQLGYLFDEGKQISTGEWQKIALARAIVKDNSFFILDEPNSALDPISDYNISTVYKEILSNSTGIIIAHRFMNLIEYSDRVIVVDEGKIIEEGTHDELLKQNGIYSELYNRLRNTDISN